MVGPSAPTMNLIEALEIQYQQFIENEDGLDEGSPLTPAGIIERFEGKRSEYDDESSSSTSEDSDDSYNDEVCDDHKIENGKESNQCDQLEKLHIEDSKYSNQYNQLTTTHAQNSKDLKRQSVEFLELPYDVRRMIYLRLLRTNEVIDSANAGLSFADYTPDGNGHDLHPQILGTCRQVHSESRDVLYGENLFQVSVWEFHDTCGLRKQCNPYRSRMGDIRPLKFRDMKRVEVVVNDSFFRLGLAEAIRSAGRVLSQLRELRHVSVKFCANEDIYTHLPKPDTGCSDLLQGLSMIRNVRNADVDGVPPEYAQYLIEKMTTSSPIPRMYFALEFYAGSIECSLDALQKAYDAAIWDDFDGFFAARQKVIEAVTGHMTDATDLLLHYDPSQEEMQKYRQSFGCKRYERRRLQLQANQIW